MGCRFCTPVKGFVSARRYSNTPANRSCSKLQSDAVINRPTKLIFVVTFLAANAKQSPGRATELVKMKHLWNAWLSKEGQNNVRAAGWETASAGTFYTHPGAVGFSALSAFSSSLLSKSFDTAFCFLVPLGGDFVFTGTVNSSRWQISIHDQIELFLNSLKGKKTRVCLCVWEDLLTCPSDLAPPLAADEELFLKGMLTFHPFMSGWKRIKEPT